MSDKKSDDVVLAMPATNGQVDGNSKGKPFPTFTPARSKADALKGITSLDNNRGASVLAYCLSSMSMTIVNKYVISGSNWNMNLLYLAVQSIVGTVAIVMCKQAGLVKDLGPFDSQKAKT
ncbi:hypothetical protein E4U55_007335, partial [Claviceps digitariae]